MRLTLGRFGGRQNGPPNNNNAPARDFLFFSTLGRCFCSPPKAAVPTKPALPLETSSRFTLDRRAALSLIGAAPSNNNAPARDILPFFY
eukprot:284046-Pyramimonas_sp.AAC.1